MWRRLTKETTSILADIRTGDIMSIYTAIYSIILVGAVVIISRRNILAGGMLLLFSPVPIILLTIFTKLIWSWFTGEEAQPKEVALVVEKYSYPKNNTRKVGISIFNRESDDITIYIKPINLKRFEHDESYGWRELNITLENNDRFDLGKIPMVETNDNKSFTFAEIQKNEIVFLLSGKPYISEHTHYIHTYIRQPAYNLYEIKWELEFEIYGKINSKAFRKSKFKTEISSTRTVPNVDWNTKYNPKYDTVTIEIGEITHVEQENITKETD